MGAVRAYDIESDQPILLRAKSYHKQPIHFETEHFFFPTFNYSNSNIAGLLPAVAERGVSSETITHVSGGDGSITYPALKEAAATP